MFYSGAGAGRLPLFLPLAFWFVALGGLGRVAARTGIAAAEGSRAADSPRQHAAAAASYTVSGAGDAASYCSSDRIQSGIWMCRESNCEKSVGLDV